MKVTIGIPTYNRKELLEYMATSLYDSELLDICNIRIYDDCSTEFSKDELITLFPNAASINVSSNNVKADKNMFLMYKDFASTNDDYFFNADSDFLFNKNWLEKALDLIPQTDGVLSIFNANSHQEKESVGDELVIKASLGAAGTFFTRERMLEVVDHFNDTKDFNSFDWQWSKYFTSRGINLYCVSNSLMQHIGYNGQNSKHYFDVGLGYKVTDQNQGQILNDILVKSMSNIRNLEQKRKLDFEKNHAIHVNDFYYHFKRCVVILLKKIIPKKIYSKLR